MSFIYSITLMKDEEHVLDTSLYLGHCFHPQFPTRVWKTFKFQVFNPNLLPALPTAMGWRLKLQNSSDLSHHFHPALVNDVFVFFMPYLLPVTLCFEMHIGTGQKFQIITPSCQSPPESPQHQCLSWVMHGMEPHTVCSRHWNHGNAPDMSCSLGWSEEMVAEGSLSCLPLLPQAR